MAPHSSHTDQFVGDAPGRGQIEALNGIRGLAALAVLLLHGDLVLKRELIPNGYLAVDLFFILSGYVLNSSYEGRLKVGRLNFCSFCRLRAVRFYPLFLIGLGLGAVFELIHHIHHPPGNITLAQWFGCIVFGLAFLPSPIPPLNYLYPLNGPAWSLFYELIVNVLYATKIGRWGSGHYWLWCQSALRD